MKTTYENRWFFVYNCVTITWMKKKVIYLDNAATTQIDNEVLAVMLDSLKEDYGNPSSVHSLGRKAKSKMELVRKQIAKAINAKSSEIIFTSGGTEANNIAIKSLVEKQGVTTIITSKIEHPSVLKLLEHLSLRTGLKLLFVKLSREGVVDLVDLESLLKSSSDTAVSLMHGNNELGNLLALDAVGELCKQNNSFFHCDTVQTIGHESIDLEKLNIDYISCSAHKIHGPKGVGFLYAKTGSKVFSIIKGGGQERGYRAGTEDVPGILALGTAFQICQENLLENEAHILELKKYCQEQLRVVIEGVDFNGDSSGKTLSSVLSIHLPSDMSLDAFLFSLDLDGVHVSGGSACASGSVRGSTVLSVLQKDEHGLNVRISFSRFNSKKEVLAAVEAIAELIN